MTAKEAIALMNCGQPGSPMRIAALKELRDAVQEGNNKKSTCCIKCKNAEFAATGRYVAVFIVCDTCGNKRCPKATNHELECTGSNESGQAGSIYSHG